LVENLIGILRATYLQSTLDTVVKVLYLSSLTAWGSGLLLALAGFVVGIMRRGKGADSVGRLRLAYLGGLAGIISGSYLWFWLFVDRGPTPSFFRGAVPTAVGTAAIFTAALGLGIGLFRLAGLLALPGRGSRKEIQGKASPWPTVGLAGATALSVAIGLAYLHPRGSGLGGNSTAPSLDRPPAVVHVGLDGGCWNFLLPLLREGKLPHLRRLMDEGVWSGISTTYPCLSPLIWTTIATGRRHEVHGIRGFKETETGPGGELVRSYDRTAKAVWEVASEHGKRACVVDWMVTWPPDSLNGYLVSRLTLNETRKTHPLALQSAVEKLPAWQALVELKESHADAAMDAEGALGYTQFKVDRAMADLCLAEAVSLDLYARERFDYFAVYEHATDELSHHYWPRCQEKPDSCGPYGRVLENCWVQVDSFLGDLSGRLDQNTTLIICSDHGLRGAKHPPLEKADVRLFLLDLGLFAYEPGLGGINWSRTKAIPLAIEEKDELLRIVLKVNAGGREKGKRQDPRLVAALRDSVGDLFERMVREEDGERVFRGVERIGSGQRGPSGHAPPGDLVLLLESARLPAMLGKHVRHGATRLSLDTIARRASLGIIHGDHWKEGIFVARGPGIRRGAALRDVLDAPFRLRLERTVDRYRLSNIPVRGILRFLDLVEPISVFDLSPTIAHLLGLPVEVESDGSVATWILTADFARAHPVRAVTAYGPRNISRPSEEVSTGEEEYRQRLRALGYIE
jgi:hypothetical protein